MEAPNDVARRRAASPAMGLENGRLEDSLGLRGCGRSGPPPSSRTPLEKGPDRDIVKKVEFTLLGCGAALLAFP
jgi:hypothetical protein